MLPIAGFQGTSLIDYPGKISSIIFLSGCNLRCPYCHNSLLFEVQKEMLLNRDDVIASLIERKNFIDGVVITGGEPTLYPDVIDFIKEIKNRTSLLIKFDSNGLNSEFLNRIIDLVDYFAIDIKALPGDYSSVLGAQCVTEDIEKELLKTKNLLESSKKEVEYRTTLYPGVIRDKELFREMMKFIPSRADYYLQQFMSKTSWHEDAVITTPFSENQINGLLSIAKESLSSVSVRGL